MKAIILAAGKGTRFASERTKVLQKLGGKTLLQLVIELADAVGITEKIIVIGYQGKEVQQSLARIAGISGILFVWQRKQQGTGHAVMMAKPFLKEPEEILILYGDVPALRRETLQKLLVIHRTQKNSLTLLTAELKDPAWYGRILRDKKKTVIGIREAKDCSAEELKINEINSGIMVVDSSFLCSALNKINNNNEQKEYYLTDMVQIACREGKKVGACTVYDEEEIKGINSMEELEEMRKIFTRRKKFSSSNVLI